MLIMKSSSDLLSTSLKYLNRKIFVESILQSCPSHVCHHISIELYHYVIVTVFMYVLLFLYFAHTILIIIISLLFFICFILLIIFSCLQCHAVEKLLNKEMNSGIVCVYLYSIWMKVQRHDNRFLLKVCVYKIF